MVEKINGLYVVFSVVPEAQVVKDNNAAGARARNASLAIEKELKNFRHVSMETTK